MKDQDSTLCDQAWASVDNGNFGKNYKAMPEKDEYAKLVMIRWAMLIGELIVLGVFVWGIISLIF